MDYDIVEQHEERMELLHARLADIAPCGVDPSILEEITADDYEAEGGSMDRQKVWHGYNINDSSNVSAIMWVKDGMVVTFGGGATYLYKGVSRQRAVAAARAKSVGQYINRVIKPNFEVVKLDA